jgi:transcription antitermination factor NusG
VAKSLTDDQQNAIDRAASALHPADQATFRRRVLEQLQALLHWHEVRRTPDVTQIVMQGGVPAQLDDAIVEELKARAGPNGLIRPPRRGGLTFWRGDRIRVRGGPLTGRVGIFEGMRSHERVAVLLSLLGASQRVELPANHVEAVDDQDKHDQVR